MNHEYCSCSNGKYDLYYLKRVQGKFDLFPFIVFFYCSPCNIVSAANLYLIRRREIKKNKKIKEQKKEEEEREKNELLMKKEFDYLTSPTP